MLSNSNKGLCLTGSLRSKKPFFFVFILLVLSILSILSIFLHPNYSVMLSSRIVVKKYKLRAISSNNNNDILFRDLVMLKPEDKMKVEYISKYYNNSQIEIIIAAFNEDLTWTKMYANITTVYLKGDKNKVPTFLPRIYQLPNLGRETYTYLYHIVHNYDRLSDLTVFTQGESPTRGYKGHLIGGGHMYCTTTFHDYLLNIQGYFVFTEIMSLYNSVHSVRDGYNSDRCIRPHSTRNLTTNSCYCPNESEAILSPARDHPITVDLIAKYCTLHHEEDACSPTLFWDKYIKLPRPNFNLAWYAQGAIFSVTRNDIHKRPKSDYQALSIAASKGQDTSTGFFMEYFWYYLLTSPTPESIACPSCNNISLYNFINEYVNNRPIIESYTVTELAAFLKTEKRLKVKPKLRQN